jgi:hypothetical protein
LWCWSNLFGSALVSTAAVVTKAALERMASLWASMFGLSAVVQKEFSWFERSQSRVELMNEVVVDMVVEDMVLFLDSTLKAMNTLI